MVKEYTKFNNASLSSLQGTLHKAKEDKMFSEILNKYKIEDKLALKYTSILKKSACEANNCKNCKSLLTCKNEVQGHVYLPEVDKLNNRLLFDYVPCKHQIKQSKDNGFRKNVISINLPFDITNASMKDIDVSDKKRVNLVKYLDNFINEYPRVTKGLYLSGSFGSGKTYLVSACINEIAKKDIKVAMIYWPLFIKKLKEFNVEATKLFNSVMKAKVLLIDDMGAETVTSWSRDEILASILQYRMEEHLPTFFTSNLTIDELETHLSMTKDNTDKVKARRIIERIKQLTEPMELISENRRG